MTEKEKLSLKIRLGKRLSYDKRRVMEIIKEEIDKTETTIERSHGKWKKTPKAVMGEGYMWYCDKCEHQVYQDSTIPYPSENFCPNCGSDNRKSGEYD